MQDIEQREASYKTSASHNLLYLLVSFKSKIIKRIKREEKGAEVLKSALYLIMYDKTCNSITSIEESGYINKTIKSCITINFYHDKSIIRSYRNNAISYPNHRPKLGIKGQFESFPGLY